MKFTFYVPDEIGQMFKDKLRSDDTTAYVWLSTLVHRYVGVKKVVYRIQLPPEKRPRINPLATKRRLDELSQGTPEQKKCDRCGRAWGDCSHTSDG